VIINPPELGAPRGWSNGVIAPARGRLLFVAGQTATDAGGNLAAGFAAQFDRALEKALTVVEAAGGRPEHVARMTVYVVDLDAYRRDRQVIGEAWRQRMGRHYPAMALVEVSRLLDEGALVEIEATAVLPAEADDR
jgi:enamine deaminase RidA (YjgF/YER057c/UK114 family)